MASGNSTKVLAPRPALGGYCEWVRFCFGLKLKITLHRHDRSAERPLRTVPSASASYIGLTDITSTYLNFFFADLTASCSARSVLRVSASCTNSCMAPSNSLPTLSTTLSLGVNAEAGLFFLEGGEGGTKDHRWSFRLRNGTLSGSIAAAEQGFTHFVFNQTCTHGLGLMFCFHDR